MNCYFGLLGSEDDGVANQEVIRQHIYPPFFYSLFNAQLSYKYTQHKVPVHLPAIIHICTSPFRSHNLQHCSTAALQLARCDLVTGAG